VKRATQSIVATASVMRAVRSFSCGDVDGRELSTAQ